MLNIKIHRGTSQIGGTITEIYTENTHIFIDFGSELTVNPEDSTDSKMIDMMKNAQCDAVLFSHYHGDHIGLLDHIPQKDVRGKEILLGMGQVARQVIVNIHKTLANNNSTSPKERQFQKELLDVLQNTRRWKDFTDGCSFQIGDFQITTLRVDHSAYDSYMFIIEAKGKCIVHTGDFRVHGRLGKKFFPRLQSYMQGKKADVLLLEGTMLGRLDEKVMSEEKLQAEATRLLTLPENKYAFLICSSTNMESLASFYKAVLFSNERKKKNGYNDNRAMYVNFYVKEQMNVFGAAEPDITWEFRKVYPFEKYGEHNEKLEMSQIEYMKENGFLCMIGTSDGYKKYIELFEEENPLLIYSMWDGYVNPKKADTNDKKLKALYESFERKVNLHTSGHAVKKDLEQMIQIINPAEAIIPIHTEFKEDYRALNGVGNKVRCVSDGEVFCLEEKIMNQGSDKAMTKWDAYVRELVLEIKKNESAVVVGITGSYVRRKPEDKCLRVYMNGGDVLKLHLEKEKFEFASKKYLTKTYLNEWELKRIEEIKKNVLKNLYTWREQDYSLLKEYLTYMEKATRKKFGELKSSATKMHKERMYQMNFFKKLVSDTSKEYAFMDVEFQTIREMNYPDEKIAAWKKKYGNKKRMHCGKPDYIAIHEGGFYIVELKTNEKSLGGKAGIKEHDNDFNVFIEMNKKNQVFATELKERLKVMYEYGLLNNSYRGLAERILNKRTDELTISERYMFITNKEFTKEQCEKYVEKMGIDKSKVIYEEE